MSLFQGRDLVCVRGERRVFAGLDFALPAGGALVLTGPNGSGKSSLLRLLAGLMQPAAGHMTWDGRPLAEDPEAHRARLHYVGHLDAVKPVLTAAENLAFWAAPASPGAGAGAATGTAAVEAALARFDLAWLAGVAGRLLSAGQRRRLSLARLLVAPAELWLLDEPSVGLDEDSLARLHDILSEHRQTGGRLVVATHARLDLPEAAQLSLADFAPGPESPWEEAAW